MDVAIVYESMFGNTRVIADAIAAGVHAAHPTADVAVLHVSEATPDKIAEASLLVVGAPTHALGMSRTKTRQQAVDAAVKSAKKGGRPGGGELQPGAAGPGVRDWLQALPVAAGGRRAAAFDTRLPFPLAGGAARAISRRLRKRGYALAAKPHGFVVAAAEGPLREGEQERAKAWGAGLLPQRVEVAVH